MAEIENARMTIYGQIDNKDIPYIVREKLEHKRYKLFMFFFVVIIVIILVMYVSYLNQYNKFECENISHQNVLHCDDNFTKSLNVYDRKEYFDARVKKIIISNPYTGIDLTNVVVSTKNNEMYDIKFPYKGLNSTHNIILTEELSIKEISIGINTEKYHPQNLPSAVQIVLRNSDDLIVWSFNGKLLPQKWNTIKLHKVWHLEKPYIANKTNQDFEVLDNGFNLSREEKLITNENNLQIRLTHMDDKFM